LGSNYQFFDQPVLDRIEKDICKTPTVIGELEYDADTLQPISVMGSHRGRLQLWCDTWDMKNVPKLEFALGADIATGTGSSNSVLSIGNRRTGEKVAEFATSMLKPDALAKMAISLARYFNNAYMIWEANGPGRIFGDTVLENGYRHIYYRTNDKDIKKKVSDVPGFYTTRDTGVALLGAYRAALSGGLFINHSKQAIYECREYVFSPNGAVCHSATIGNEDPTGAAANHGDRVIADALLWKAMTVRRKEDEKPEEEEGGEKSFAYRRSRREAASRTEEQQLVGWGN
jgi:hypothetical protein